MTPPTPHDAHCWLTQLVGEWTFESQAPSPEMKSSGTERIRQIGDLWIVCESEMTIPGGGRGQAVLTIGYDPARGRFVGTWIGSMMTTLWVYDGELDAAGRHLSLYADGPAFDETGNFVAGQTAHYCDATLLNPDGSRTFTGSIKTPDGSWHTFMTAHYRRR